MSFLRRGSKKSLVKEIRISSACDSVRKRTTRDNNGFEFNLHKPEETIARNIDSQSISLEKKENELRRLRNENDKLEKARIVLEDKASYFEKLCNEKEAEILSLTSRIEALKCRNDVLESQNPLLDATYKAKIQHSLNLEEELDKVQEDCRKTVKQLQQKIKRLRESHAKSKQDYALKVFALKDENRMLTKENNSLNDRLKGTEEISEDRIADRESIYEPECSPRNQLVIQLSEQVTTLDVENKSLRLELEKLKKSLLENHSLNEGTARCKSRIKSKPRELCVVNLTAFDSISRSHSQLQLNA